MGHRNPLFSVGIFRPKFVVLFLANRFFALIREFGKRIEMIRVIPIGGLGLIGKLSLHFPLGFPLISDQSVWRNGMHPIFSLAGGDRCRR